MICSLFLILVKFWDLFFRADALAALTPSPQCGDPATRTSEELELGTGGTRSWSLAASARAGAGLQEEARFADHEGQGSGQESSDYSIHGTASKMAAGTC